MKVYLEFRSQKHHTFYDELINYPPEGVEYQVSSGAIYSTVGYKPFNIIYNKFLKGVAPFIGNIYHSLKNESKNSDLIHVCSTFTPQKINWVIDIEHVGAFTSFNRDIFRSNKRKIEKGLSSKYCKKIMPWTYASQKTIENFLDTSDFKDKLEVVRPTIHSINQNKNRHDNKKIRLLFMGSINNPETFVFKGGKDILQSFEILMKKYDIELIVRSIVPEEIKNKYLKYNNIQFLEKALSKEEIYKFYRSSDIVLLSGPAYSLMAILESMAFGLPIVATSGWATAEFVEHGKTGFLGIVSKYFKVGEEIPIDWTPDFWYGIQKVDQAVVDDLVKYTSLLIEDNSLRIKMGENARKKIENGDLSIKVRNQKLKRIYEEALRR